MRMRTITKLVGLLLIMFVSDAKLLAEPCPSIYVCDYGDPNMGMQGVASCNENQCDGICKGGCGENSDYLGWYSCLPCADTMILICACSDNLE